MSWKVIRKGIITIMACFLLTLMAGKTVSADLIWEPNDEFYHSHSAYCEDMNRRFTANGPKGNVVLWKSPESKKKIAAYENGTDVYVTYTYTNKKDVTWGIVEMDGNTGWIRMDEFMLVYDIISFCEEHKDEFQEYQGEFDDYAGDSAIIIWSYPGSGVQYGQFDKADSYHDFIYTYTDEDGRLWGYYAFTGGQTWVFNRWDYSAGWICLSDPSNQNLPVREVEQPTIIPPSPIGDLSEKTDHYEASTLLLLAGAVVALITFTTILIRVFWKKKEVHSDH